jgi:hypothetical protein
LILWFLHELSYTCECNFLAYSDHYM